MNRISQLFALCLAMLFSSMIPSLAQLSSVAPKRIALVVGNSNYTKIQSLPNPANDSKLMAQTLRGLGFEVISAVDTNRITLSRAVRDFGRALRKSGKDTVGLFYYAGHGVQARGENYLIPLGAEVEDEADLEIEAITASVVLSQMEAAGNALNLVILDACRNNPYQAKLRSISRGLARVKAASGSLVAFAAAPGQVAADGDGENSPYTAALVKAMQIPGLSVEQMFKKVRISVEAQTNNQQTPWEESSLRGDFYFNPQKAEPEHVATPEVDRAAQEWVNIQNVQSTAVLKAFIKRYPTSIYSEYARAILTEKVSAADEARAEQRLRASAALKKQRQISPGAIELSFWNSIQSSNNPAMFKDYIARYPKGNFTFIAIAKLEALKKPKNQKVASLQKNPPDTLPRTQPMTPRELTILLQAELTRVGCSPGAIDGQWGPKGRRALTLFKRYASLTLPYKDISPEVVDAIKQKRSRVCPKSAPVKARKSNATVKSTKTKKQQTTGETYYLYRGDNTKYKTWSECAATNNFTHWCDKMTR